MPKAGSSESAQAATCAAPNSWQDIFNDAEQISDESLHCSEHLEPFAGLAVSRSRLLLQQCSIEGLRLVADRAEPALASDQPVQLMHLVCEGVLAHTASVRLSCLAKVMSSAQAVASAM